MERVGLVPKLVWRVKLVAELRSGVMTETEVARIERDEQAGWPEFAVHRHTTGINAIFQKAKLVAKVCVSQPRVPRNGT